MREEEKALFTLDTPNTKSFEPVVRSPFVVSGWVIPSGHKPISGIEVDVNGQLRSKAAAGLRRPDVQDAFPDRVWALWSGFAAEVYVDDFYNSRVTVTVRAIFDGGELTIARFRARVDGLVRVVPPRKRAWTLADILACPLCLAYLDETESFFQCHGCKREFHKRRGTPVFTNGGEAIQSRLFETNPTNPNGEDHTKIINNPANQLVLDLGAGNPRESEHYPNVVFHEFVHYAYTDVVSVCDKLPYQEGVFDAVISKATFEHLARPWDTADEIYRVLKPGGLVHVDTAFMQPLHADPYHFFNMTLDGAKEIFKRFKTVRCGVKPYQTPSYGLRMQIGVLLEHLLSEDWRLRFEELRDSIGVDLDNALDTKGHERLAAGVFFEGTKPDDYSD